MDLKVISYNCNSFRTNSEIISRLLGSSDILFIQESFICDNDSAILENFNNDFYVAVEPAVRREDVFVGRSMGGLAVFWRKSLNMKIVPVYFNNSRFLGLNLRNDDMSYLLICVYMNCDYRNIESLMEYKFNLSDLAELMCSESFDEVILTGDFNSGPSSRGTFFQELSNFALAFDLKFADIINLPSDSFTYIGRGTHIPLTWLDHTLTSNLDITNNNSILYDFSVDDHLPISFDITFPKFNTQFALNPDYDVSLDPILYRWNDALEEDLKLYANILDDLSSCKINEIFYCNNMNCDDHNHRDELTALYEEMLLDIQTSSMYIPRSVSRQGYKVVVGWNDFVKDKHYEARCAFLCWVSNGRVHSGPLYENMTRTRSIFRSALRDCKAREMEIKKNKFLNLYAHADKKKFWRELNKLKPKNRIDIIDDEVDPQKISDIFAKKFCGRLDSQLNNSVSHSYGPVLNVMNSDYNFPISFAVLKKAILNLKNSLGFDGIHSNHIKFAGDSFLLRLYKFFVCLIRHNFIPNAMLCGEIRPVIKDNKVSKSSASNYRPIMNSSIFMKIFEYVLLPVITDNVELCDQQLGFRNASGCTDAILLLKEIIMRYNSEGSDVFCAQIDLSKAFDNIDHDILLEKLLDSNVPIAIVRIVGFMIKNSYTHVRFKNCRSPEWRINAGCRQGGILSPLLFNVYLLELVRKIAKICPGCELGYVKWNIIAYADDILLLAPSAKALQMLLDTFCELINGVKLKINPNKSKFIVFRKDKKNVPIHRMRIGESILEEVDSIKYLGCMLDARLNDAQDCDRALDAFLKQFNGMFHKFYYMNRDVLTYLFKAYTSSFYACELWCGKYNRERMFKKISVGYHKAIKRLCYLPIWSSNHLACELIGVDIFNHLQAKRMVGYAFRVFSSKSKSLECMKYYFRYHSYFFNCVSEVFYKYYDLDNVFDNDLDAVLARIDFVQRSEPRSDV